MIAQGVFDDEGEVAAALGNRAAIAQGVFDDEGEVAAALGSRAVGPGKGEQLVARRRQVPALGIFARLAQQRVG